jgi:hypothetical protein
VGFYLIWETRNEARNSDVKANPIRTGGKIVAYVDMIKQHIFKTATEHRCVSTVATNSWSQPPSGTVLINSDVAIFEASRSMGAGVVVRDHHGTCLVACCQHLHGSPPQELAEALALRRAVELARNEGFDRAIFESDCLSLVHRLNSQLMDRSSVGIIVAGIKHLVKDFSLVTFRHVKRVFNEAAYRLAKFLENVNSSFTFYSAPDFIRELFVTLWFD